MWHKSGKERQNTVFVCFTCEQWCSELAMRPLKVSQGLRIIKIRGYLITFHKDENRGEPPAEPREGRSWMSHLDFCKLCCHLSLSLSLGRSLFASAVVSTDWRAESLELIAHVHIWSSTSRQCSIPLFRLESPFSSSNRTSRAALVQASSPPPLIFTFPHNSQPFHSLTTTIARERTRTGQTERERPGAARSSARLF